LTFDPPDLSIRASNILRQAGVDTLEQLKALADSGRLWTIKGIGRKTEKELIEFLIDGGHCWSDATADVVRARSRVEAVERALKRARERYDVAVRRQVLAKRRALISQPR